MQMKPLGCNLVGIETDGDGMIPDSLASLMSRWSPEDALKPNSAIPRVLYTIPNGVNPTGASMTFDRKKAVYEVCISVPMTLMTIIY